MDEHIRLLIAGVKWPPETFILRLVRGLVNAGVRVTVACSRRPAEKGVQWLPVPSDSWTMLERFLYYMQAIGGAVMFRPQKALQLWYAMGPSQGRIDRFQAWSRLLPIARRQWDLVYFPWNSAAIQALPAFSQLPPVVVSCRGSQVLVAPHNPARASIRDGHRCVFSRAVAVHCVSEAIKQEAMKYGLPAEKAWVIRPAVDPNVFKPIERKDISSQVVRIASCGSLNWKKGYEYALQAVRLAVDRGCTLRFDIIGDGPERQRVLYTIHDLGLEGVVRLHYLQPEEYVVRLLQQSDLFLLASHSEGISNAVLEAMSCGLPVITTDCGGMREAVTDGVEGLVVSVRNPNAMAQAVVRLASDPELRRRMGEAARARILREFTIDQHIRKWLELLSFASGRRFREGREAACVLP